MSVPIDAPVWRPLMCPVCAQLCGATDKDRGVNIIYCKRCRAWKRVDETQASERHVDLEPLLRLVIEDDDASDR